MARQANVHNIEKKTLVYTATGRPVNHPTARAESPSVHANIAYNHGGNSCEGSGERGGRPGDNTTTATVTVTMVEGPTIDNFSVMEPLNIVGCNGCNNPSYYVSDQFWLHT